jgi:hypothetical protein
MPPPFACVVGTGVPAGGIRDARLFGALACSLVGCSGAGLLPAHLLDTGVSADASPEPSGAVPDCDEVGTSSSHAEAELVPPSSFSTSFHFFSGLL